MSNPPPAPKDPQPASPHERRDRQTPALDAPDVVRALYRGILQREPDPSGAAAYLGALGRGVPLDEVIRQLVTSTEFAQLHAARQPASAVDPSRGPESRLPYAAAVHKRLFGRSPDAAALERVLDAAVPIGRTVADWLKSGRSPTARPARVLLFGAFGNGNLGDALQASALQDLLGEAWGLPRAAFAACSLLRSAPFPFDGDVLPPQTILDADAVGQFDHLVIGGGGLLAHRHDPLADASWVGRLRLPIHLLGVGATTAHMPRHQALLEVAATVSGRDTDSLAALRTVRPDARLLIDPVLSIGDPARLRSTAPPEAAWPAEAGGGAPRTVWFLKYPSNALDEQFLDRIAALLRGQPAGSQRIVALEPSLDRVLEDRFPDHAIQYATDFDTVDTMVRDADRVVSMRYHGFIFALLQRRPVIGLSQIKIRALCALLGDAAPYAEDPDHLQRLMQAPASLTDPARLADLRQRFGALVRQVLPPPV